MKNSVRRNEAVRRMAVIALFTALAYVVMIVIHVKVAFLTLDVKDAVITLCGLYFGPLSALFIAVVVPLLELAVSSTGFYGLIMNILGSVSFSVTASLIYKYKKTLVGAIVGLATGATVMVAVMLLANLFITPYYMGVTAEVVREMIPTLLLPFNVLKSIINVGVVLLLYKTFSKALKRAGFLHGTRRMSEDGGECAPVLSQRKKWVSLAVTLSAVLLIAAASLLIFTVFKGQFQFGTK